jgi:integrase
MILRRKTRAGKVRYGVRVDRAGKQAWIGTFATIAEARKAEAKARLDRRSSPMSCDRFAEFWLEGYRERRKASSYDTAAAALRGFVDDFRGIPLARVDSITAERWARSNGWRIPVVITMMNTAVEADLIERNPFKGLSHKGPGRRHATPLTVDDVDRMAAAARRLHGQVISSFVIFTAYTGMRVGEVFALQWPDIDFNRNRVTVARRVYRGQLDLPKSNRRREIVLPPPARDALLPLDRSSDWIFTGKRGGRMSQSGLAYYWRGIEGAFGRKVTPHELKHFAGHYLYVTLGLPDRVVAEQLGHRDGGKLVRELYGHGDVGALEEIDRAFESNVIPLRKAAGQSQGQ